MSWVKRHRGAWWAGLVALLTVLLLLRRDSLEQSPTVIDVVLFVTWIALLLSPLFQEVSLLGLTLKKEIDEFKAEVRDQFFSIRTAVQSSAHSQVHVQINPQTAPSLKITPGNVTVEEETPE
ncbi:MAG: hypothetical protein ABSA92_02480 [Candidatus Bathyarchaeia archaeon]